MQLLSEVTNGDPLVGGALSSKSIAASTDVVSKASGRWIVGAGVVALSLIIAWSVFSSVGTDQDPSIAGGPDDRLVNQVSDEPNGQPGFDRIQDSQADGSKPISTIEGLVGDTTNVEQGGSEQRGSEQGGSAQGGSAQGEPEEGGSDQDRSDEPVAAFGSEGGPAYVIVDEAGDPAEAAIVADMDFALLVSSRQGRFLLDPVTGGSTVLSIELGVLHLVTDTHIVGREGSETISIPLDDVSAAPVVLGFHFDEVDVWTTEQTDQLRATVWQNEGTVETLHDLNTGAVTEVERPRGQFGVQRVGSSDLFSTVGSGIYREVNGTYQKLSDGLGLAANANAVLVNRCDDLLRCMNVWLDRQSGDVLDYPAPDVDFAGLWGFEASDDGRWLLNLSNGLVAVFDIKTGRQLDLDRFAVPSGGPGIYRNFDLSSDGSWLAFTAGIGEVVLINLDSETEFRLLIDEPIQDVYLFPRSSLGS